MKRLVQINVRGMWVIQLIHKNAVICLIECLKPNVTDVWSLVSTAHIPIYIKSSSTQYASFHAFLKLLEQAQHYLSAPNFVSLLKESSANFIAQLPTDNSKPMTSINQFLEMTPINSLTIDCEESHSITILSDSPSQYLFLAELYLLAITHAFLKKLDANLMMPIKYHLTRLKAEELSDLKINHQTPQFLGQENTRLFYPNLPYFLLSDLKQTPIKIASRSFSYSKQVSEVLEGYIGGENLSLLQFSQIVMVGERTLQRSLKSEGTSYRSIKDALNISFAKRIMLDRNASISDVTEHLGYADTSQFIRAFKRHSKVTPYRWIKQTKNQE